MKHLPVFALVASLLLVLSACGSTEDDSALVDALAANWIEEEEFPEGVSIDCVAAGFVSGIGGAEGASAYEITADNIAEADFDLNPLSREDANAAIGNMFACDGFESAILSEMGPGVTDEQAACLSENIDDGPLQALMATTFMRTGTAPDDPEVLDLFETGLLAALSTCEVGG